jgi:hypothetical protein
MLFDFIILTVCAAGTIASATNAAHAESIGGMLFWDFAGGYQLVVTILKVIQIFA